MAGKVCRFPMQRELCAIEPDLSGKSGNRRHCRHDADDADDADDDNFEIRIRRISLVRGTSWIAIPSPERKAGAIFFKCAERALKARRMIPKLQQQRL